MNRNELAALAFADQQYTDHTIERSVWILGVKMWEIRFASGWSFQINLAENPHEIVPVAGMPVRLWGKGIGHIVRGMALDGDLLYWESEDNLITRYKERSGQ
jgi:hypothetical protein